MEPPARDTSAGFIDVPHQDFLFTVGKHAPLSDPRESSMWSLFCASCQRFAPNECLGARRASLNGAEYGHFEWLTYSQLFDCASAFGSAVARGALGLAPAASSAPAAASDTSADAMQQPPAASLRGSNNRRRGASIARPGDFGIILADNSPEWVIAEYGMHRQSVVPVPLYTKATVATTVHVLELVLPVLAVVDRDLLDMLLTAVVESNVPSLRTVVIVGDAPSVEDTARAAALSINCVAFTEFLETGKVNWAEPVPPSATDFWSVLMTAGTDSRGTVVTHAQAAAITDRILSWPVFQSPMLTETWLSYLPLSHVHERCFVASLLRGGARIGFGTGKGSQLLFDDIEELRPTILSGVPRIWKRVNEIVSERVENSGRLKSWMFNHALGVKSASWTGRKRSWINWDKLVFARMRQKMGGRVRLFMSSTAPLPPELSRWLSHVFLVGVYQCYGLTELGGTMCMSVDYNHIDSVGYPLPGTHIRLVDVPEMSYTTSSMVPTGEIWVHTSLPFSGYLGDASASQSILREGGFIATGDIGRLNVDGTLSIIDRRASSFKIATGMYVQAESLEAFYSELPIVSQIWIHGDATEPFIVAVVVPDPDELIAWLRSFLNPIAKLETITAICQDKKVREQVRLQLEEAAKRAGRQNFEIPKSVYLECDNFTVANGLLTPMSKLRRDHLKRRYKDRLSEMLSDVLARSEENVDGVRRNIKLPVCRDSGGLVVSGGHHRDHRGRKWQSRHSSLSRSPVQKLCDAADPLDAPPMIYHSQYRGAPSATSLPASLSSSNGLSACGSPPPHDNVARRERVVLPPPPLSLTPPPPGCKNTF